MKEINLKAVNVNRKKVKSISTQVTFEGVLAKRRKIAHLEEDGGCGHTWYTVEVVEDALAT